MSKIKPPLSLPLPPSKAESETQTLELEAYRAINLFALCIFLWHLIFMAVLAPPCTTTIPPKLCISVLEARKTSRKTWRDWPQEGRSRKAAQPSETGAKTESKQTQASAEKPNQIKETH